MAGRLVTIATFNEVIEARLAQSALEAAGIKVAITEDDASSVIGQFTFGVNGIKVLVREEDEEQAVKVLDETFEDKSLDDEELVTQAEDEMPEDVNEAAEQPAPVNDPAADSLAREKEARFAVSAVLFGFLIPFGHLFALVMILQACSGPGKLSREGRYHIYAAILIFAFIYLPLLIFVLFLINS